MTTVFNCLKSIILLLLFIGHANAQAPGGVSNNLGLWLKSIDLDPNAPATINSNGTSDWPDARSNGNNAIFHPSTPNGNNASQYAIRQDINFNNTIRLNDEWFDAPININQANVNVFMVYKLKDNSDNRPLWGNSTSSATSKEAHTNKVYNGTNYSTYTSANVRNKTYLSHVDITDNNTSYVNINGTMVHSYTSGATVNGNAHSGIFIGKEEASQVPSSNANTLSLAEFVVYTGALAAGAKEQINSYLAIKYGINLSHNYTIDNGNITVWDRTINGTYNSNIIGIAKDNTSGLDVNKSKSEDNGALVTLSTTQTIPNNEALLIGHNNLSVSTSSGFSTTNFFVKGKRLNRIWKCQKTTGFTMPVDIGIDNSITLPTNDGFQAGNLVLLVSDLASMDSNLKAYPLTNNTTSGNYEANDVTLANGDFFTIAYLDVALWVKADGGQNTTNSGAPYVYYDHVLGINSMSSPGVVENPSHILGSDPNSINFNPYIKFNENPNYNQFIGKANLTAFGNSGVSTFLVLRRDDVGVVNNDFETMLSYSIGSQNSGNELVISNPLNMTVSINRTQLNNGHNSSQDITTSIPHVFTNRTGNGTNVDNEIRLDGTGASAPERNGVAIASKGTLIFGQDQDNLGGGFSNSQAYEGDIAEAIIFNRRISDAHRNGIETYLALKYGITLQRSYVLTGGAVIWNINNNTTYHNNVAGIAKSTKFGLSQLRSKSQNGGSVDVEISHTGPLTIDHSYLIWGCNGGIYDNVNTINAPTGYKTSDKIWKVQNRNDRVGVVDVTLRIPPSLTSIATNKLRLIVEDNSSFSSAGTIYSTASVTPGFITFTNVTLTNGYFFTLALEDIPVNVTYNNSGNSTAPTSFEACVGDQVTFTYNNLTSHPNQLELMDDQGATFNIPLIQGGNLMYTTGLGSSGVITITIPPNTATGNVRLIDTNVQGSGVVHNFNNNLVIHKPVVDFHVLQTPICATDTVAIVGVPTGGTFSSIHTGLILNNNELVGINANWSPNTNDSIQDVSIAYSYNPTYINGQTCATPINIIKDVKIRDNRLDLLNFQYIITSGSSPSINDRVVLHLDSPIIQSISPEFNPPRTYPVSFSGNHVNHINGVDSFFADYAGYSRTPITMEYNNGGCIGSFTADLDVLFPLQLSGLVDILCNEADSIVLRRDGRPEYAYSTVTTVTSQLGGITRRETVESNIIDFVSTQNPSHQASVTTRSAIPNQEEYVFDPKSPVLNNVQVVVITMQYTASKTTIEDFDINGNLVFTQVRSARPSVIEYPITLVDRPAINFTLDSVYCKYAPPVVLNPNPTFENSYSRFNYRFSYFASGPYSPSDSLQRDTFEASYIYDQAVPLGAQNQDLYVELEYVYDRYGCTDVHRKQTKIIRPIAFSLFLDPPPIITGYCNNATPIKLEPINTITNAMGSGEFLVDGVANSPLINSSNYFLPGLAASQDYDISYQFLDTATNCTSISTVKIISIREPAVVQLEIDGNSTNPRICGNRDTALLKTVLISGSSPSSITYSSTNLIIVGDTLKPSDTYNINNVNGNIIQNITVNYRDSFSCATSDDLLVEIYKPLPKMNGFLGASNNNIYTYCNNKSAFSIIETPNHLVTRDTIFGRGVVYTNGVYSYDPNLILVDSFVMDTVRYEYEDAVGCSAVVENFIRIDSVPDISLGGLDSAYCVNNASVQLNGMPNSSSGLIQYIGAGINQQGIFSPTIAGIGTKSITYLFEDGNGCGNTVTKVTTVNGLPSPLFTFPQSQYCTSAIADTLNTNSPMGVYTFWGNIIDSNYIINPQGAVGQQVISYSLTDSLNCVDTNEVTIFVHPLPTITISGLDSAYCFNGVTDNILISPNGGNILTGSAPGFSLNSTGVTFDPSYDSSGGKIFTYTYQDNITQCVDTVWLNTTVLQVPALSYTGIDSVYCAIDSLYSIAGMPVGGVFSGAGILNGGGQYYFNPILTGGGNRTVNYRIDTNIIYNTSDTLSCPVDIDIPVVVNQLPNLAFSGPGNNHRFCSNETDVLLGGVETTATWRLFTSTTLNAIDTIVSETYITLPPYLVRDTAYFFNPDSAGAGIHNILYTGTDSLTGCLNTMSLTYNVTDYGTGASFLLDSAYCASSDSILLVGSPAGGHFLRNQDTLNTPYFTLNTSVYLLDTVTYHVTYDACMASDTQLIEINPLVNLSFVGNEASKTYCFGGDDSPLVPNISGGTFNGNAVISGDSLFSLQYANAGDNIIFYTFIDSATYCESVVTDTFFVFGMPNIDFQAIGGCQSDSVFFYPDNTILGLNNTFGSRIIDSITDIVWELEPGLFINGSNNSNNEIDSISHIYNTPGVYETKLYVVNRTHCADTTTVRVVISPTITSNQFPYDETFENSNGNWYAEAKDTSHSSLWEWGRDTIGRGINEPNNNIWVTNLNDQYGANEAAWVYSPCFDISSLERPMIRFDHWSDSRNRGDGTVLELQHPDGSWSPLGELERGISWFNSDFIAGSPGNQTLSPIGWSGQSNDWINSRYKLDEFKNTMPSKLRLRMAFGSSSINLGTFYNGFAFDNVWIGNRTRNVLLETTSNIYEPNMDYVNNYVYQLAYHSNINKDVILLQYHPDAPDNRDEFHQFDTRLGNIKPYIYGIPDAGTAFIDGVVNTKTKWLNHLSFEQNMLETPKFDIVIDTFEYSNQPGAFYMVVTVTALTDISSLDRYRINMLITEDSLSYSTGQEVHAVVRKDYTSNSMNNFIRSWAAGDQITLRHTYSATDLNYVPNHFQAVAFIQAEDPNAREVFQAATTRDVSGYWVGVDQVASEQELNEIKDMTLYPNPAKDYIKIDFPELLKKDYNWKLISIGGITVKEDVLQAGEQSLTINNYDLPSGVYIFMVYNGNVYSQRKVIINQN